MEGQRGWRRCWWRWIDKNVSTLWRNPPAPKTPLEFTNQRFRCRHLLRRLRRVWWTIVGRVIPKANTFQMNYQSEIYAYSETGFRGADNELTVQMDLNFNQLFKSLTNSPQNWLGPSINSWNWPFMTLHARQTRLKVRSQPRRTVFNLETAPGIKSASIVESFASLVMGTTFHMRSRCSFEGIPWKSPACEAPNTSSAALKFNYECNMRRWVFICGGE